VDIEYIAILNFQTNPFFDDRIINWPW
jgi:hypothetical protein